jgi:hypothetical protein
MEMSAKYNKKLHEARCWWLTPVILATQGAEIRRTAVQSQLKRKARLYLKNTQHKTELSEWFTSGRPPA